MAGHARAKAIADALITRGQDYFGDDEGIDLPINQLEYVACWVADGRTVKALAQALTDTLGFEVWAETLLRHLKRTYGDEVTQSTLDAARVRASHAMAEEALGIVDAPAYDSTEVARASSRARSRQWLAERYNPQRFGQSKGVNVSISVQSLHLDALKAASARVTVAPQSALGAGNDTNAQAAPVSQVVDTQILSEQ